MVRNFARMCISRGLVGRPWTIPYTGRYARGFAGTSAGASSRYHDGMVKRIAYGVSAVGTLTAVAMRFTGVDATITFGVAALAILGLAFTLGHATEQLGAAAGPRIGGIMNATVGNVGEIIIAAFLILDGKIEIVHASITGSIVGNLLLVLGASLLLGGLKNGVQQYDAEVTGMNAASLILATIGLVIPATFAFLVGGGEGTGPADPEFFSILALTIGVAILLLVTYAAQTWFFLRSPESPTTAHEPDEPPEWSWRMSLGVLIASAAALTVTARSWCIPWSRRWPRWASASSSSASS